MKVHLDFTNKTITLTAVGRQEEVLLSYLFEGVAHTEYGKCDNCDKLHAMISKEESQ